MIKYSADEHLILEHLLTYTAVARGEQPVVANRRTFKDRPQYSNPPSSVHGTGPSDRGNTSGYNAPPSSDPDSWERKVFVGGIPQEVQQQIHNYFTQFGQVVNVKLMFEILAAVADFAL